MHSLIRKLEAAFDGVPAPTKITLHVAEAHDDYDYDHDELHKQKDFLGRWQDIPLIHFKSCQNALAHLDAEGIRFYLPALMKWILEDYKKVDCIIDDYTIYSLSPDREDKRMSDYFDSRFLLFSADQKDICARFLESVIELDPSGNYLDVDVAKKALSGEWLKYRLA